MYKFVVTRCGRERRQGYVGHRRGGGLFADDGKDMEESFNRPIRLGVYQVESCLLADSNEYRMINTKTKILRFAKSVISDRSN